MKYINSTHRRTALSAALLAALGTGMVTSPAGAIGIANGNYVMYIKRTPLVAPGGNSIFCSNSDGGASTGDPDDPRCVCKELDASNRCIDGGLNSSFTFGAPPAFPSGTSQRMANNATSIMTPNGTRGSSTSTDTGMPADGFPGGSGAAGRIAISVNNDLVAINTNGGTPFSVDAILSTAGGTFVQYGTLQTTDAGGISKACGQIFPTATADENDPTVMLPEGTLKLRLSGRLGAVGGNFGGAAGGLHDERWNVDDFSTSGEIQWRIFNSFQSSNGIGSATGAYIRNVGDVGSGTGYGVAVGGTDGIADYSVTLVSASHVGSDWGGFFGAGYFEVWNALILSVPLSPGVIQPPSVTIPSCLTAQEEIIVDDPVLQSIKDGVHGCSLNTSGTRAADGGAWWLLAGFLAWLKALAWRRKRTTESS